jgi:Arc/MetJ family transcription regulator
MRTNIELNDRLIKKAFEYSQAKTKKDLIEEALETYLEVKEQEKKIEGYQQRFAKLSKQTEKIPSFALKLLRKAREDR